MKLRRATIRDTWYGYKARPTHLLTPAVPAARTAAEASMATEPESTVKPLPLDGPGLDDPEELARWSDERRLGERGPWACPLHPDTRLHVEQVDRLTPIPDGGVPFLRIQVACTICNRPIFVANSFHIDMGSRTTYDLRAQAARGILDQARSFLLDRAFGIYVAHVQDGWARYDAWLHRQEDVAL